MRRRRRQTRWILSLLAFLLVGGGLFSGVKSLFSTSTETHIVNAEAVGRKAVTQVSSVKPDPLPPSPPPKPAVKAASSEHVRDFDELHAHILDVLKKYQASGSVTLLELGGSNPKSWNLDGAAKYDAASTYKQVVLMMDAMKVSSGKASADDKVCYRSSDYEPGYYGDYEPGVCYKRSDLCTEWGIFRITLPGTCWFG